MTKNNFQFQLQVSFIKEGDKFIAYSPALDLSTSGDTLEQVRKRFEEISTIFFEECVRMGTLEDVLQDLGWQKKTPASSFDLGWAPPVIIGQESQRINVHL